MAQVIIRRAVLDDIPVLVHQRRRMFEDMGTGTPQGRDKMDENFALWAGRKIEQGEYLAWLALDGEQIVGGVGLWLMDWPPNPINGEAGRAYIYNVYVEPDYRSQGIARRLMETLLAECRSRGAMYANLHASDAGRTLYEKLGFKPTNEMRLFFSEESQLQKQR